MSTDFTVLPAVDISAGRADQVRTGVGDPLQVAMGWVGQGATWVHLVDLDRAHGRGQNDRLIAGLIADLPVPVQLSGGLADEAAVARAASTGAARLVLSSAALGDLPMVTRVLAEHGDRVAVGMDVDSGIVVARGTALRIGPVDDLMPQVRDLGASTHVVADAARDGRLRGADTTMFAAVAAELGAVIASGGVATLADLRSLAKLAPDGVVGAVVGAAFYSGSVTLASALDEVG